MAAIALARAGVRPVILERQRIIGDAICGGFLSWRTLDSLTRWNVPREALAGHPLTRVALFHRGASVTADLPGGAIGVSRQRLDNVLIAQAEAAGAGIECGVILREADGARLRTADGATITGEALLLATGKHELRGAARTAKPATDPTLGLRWRMPAHPRLQRLIGDAIELHLFDVGYAGLVVQEDGSANLCMAVRRSRLAAAGSPDKLLAALADEAPQLGERISFIDGATADAVANVPYGWRATATQPGVFRLGDQAGVIPSLAGEGIGIALASGAYAAAALLRYGPAGAQCYQRELSATLRRPIGIAALAWRLAERRWGARALLALAHVPGAVGSVARATRVNTAPRH